MAEELDGSIFTFYFDLMVYLGMWKIDTQNPVLKALYGVYSSLVNGWVIFTLYMGVLDLQDSLNNINKIFYNTCINPLILMTWVKGLQTAGKARRINVLQKNLYRHVSTCKDAEELHIFKSAVGDVKFITRLFYFFLVWLYPTWMMLSICSDIWGDRNLPLPAKWPGDADIEDLTTFILILVFHGVFALFFLFEAISLDVSMFGLMVQIHREYQYLIKNVAEFSDLCEDLYPDQDDVVQEINVSLEKAKANQMLGEIIVRQKELFGFTEEFECNYHSQMFFQVFVGAVLLVVNGVQTIIVSTDYNVKMAYQFGYLLTIVSDVLYLCWLANRVSTKCIDVGTAFYSTPWYKMDVDVQKNIYFVILRAQKPPRITSGNFVELNLSTFMKMMKNIYSWLALVRQVALK